MEITARSSAPEYTPWIAEVMTHGKDAGMYQVVNSKGWVIAECMVKEEAEFFAASPELFEALDYLLQQTVDMDLAHGIGLTEGEKDARKKALKVFAKATGNQP